MTSRSVQHIDLSIMNGMSTLLRRGSNVPYAFSPGTNASVGIGASAPGVAQDRLIVGVDFGTTYSGRLNAIYKSYCKFYMNLLGQVWLRYTQRPLRMSISSRPGRVGMVCIVPNQRLDLVYLQYQA